MRAIQVEQFGAAEQIVLREVENPEPGAGEVLVRLSYAGLNYIDIYMRNGTYAKSHTYQTPLPMTLGMEGVGSVEAVGAGVDAPKVGQRVSWCLVRGSYADYAVVPADRHSST